MHEKKNLPAVRQGLGCIEIRTDPKRRVSVSTLPDKPSPINEIKRRAEAIEAAANIVASGMFLTAGVGMLYLVARMGYGVIW